MQRIKTDIATNEIKTNFGIEEEVLKKYKSPADKAHEEKRLDRLISFAECSLSLKEIVNKEFPEENFVLKPLIPSRGLTLLVGNPSAGKSWLMLEMAYRISRGEKLFGVLETKKTKVLYVDEESQAREVSRRVKILGHKETEDLKFMSMAGFKVDNKIDREAFIDYVRPRGFKMIMFDTLRAIHGAEENDSTAMQGVLDGLREIASATNASILIAHHFRKESQFGSKDVMQMLRGSSAIAGALNSLVGLNTKKIDEGRRIMVLNQGKLREGKGTEPIEVELKEEGENMKFTFNAYIKTEESRLCQAKEFILSLMRGDLKETYRAEVVAELVKVDITEMTAKRAWDDLITERKISQLRKDGRKTIMHLN